MFKSLICFEVIFISSLRKDPLNSSACDYPVFSSAFFGRFPVFSSDLGSSQPLFLYISFWLLSFPLLLLEDHHIFRIGYWKIFVISYWKIFVIFWWCHVSLIFHVSWCFVLLSLHMQQQPPLPVFRNCPWERNAPCQP